ncbi:MAG: hypothetical protein KAS32_19205 [Candidatus Peribacteraceae bacterium]|nr:hypothetical protein [Candidatus Peribacteraceae bacterium]
MITDNRKNYYSAILFEERLDLHMTLKYWKSRQYPVCTRIEQVEEILFSADNDNMPLQFTVTFDEEATLGWGRPMHVLKACRNQCWPEFITGLVAPSTLPNLHVTCEDTKPLILTAVAVAIMHKGNEVCRWNLSKAVSVQPERPF